MKIRNAILALGLAIALSFSFSTTLSATTSTIPAVEDGVTGVINDLIMKNGTLVLTVNTKSTVSLSLISPSGESVWSVTTDDKTLSIPVSTYRSGTYTLTALVDGKVHFFSINI